MAKILEQPKSKPVTCKVCGCKYEFENGDTVHTTVVEQQRIGCNAQRIIIARQLDCPACGNSNDIEFIKDEEE